MNYCKSTIREVRAVVFSTTARGGDAAQSWARVQGLHAAKLDRLRVLPVVEHIGPPLQSANGGNLHAFAHVLVGIALGAEIEWNPCALSPNKPAEWRRVNSDSVLYDIGNGTATAGEYRVKP